MSIDTDPDINQLVNIWRRDMTGTITQGEARIGAAAMVGGAFLNMMRMGPIYMHSEVGFSDYPPKSLSDTLSISQLEGYYASHIMVFFATPLFLLGFWVLYKELIARGSNLWLALSLFGFFIGQIFYTLGVSIHGLILPEMAYTYNNASTVHQAEMAPLFELTHNLATGFGGLGFAFILVSTGIFGAFLRKKFALLGTIAVIIGGLAFAGYLFGVLEFMLFNNFVTTAGFVTLMFAFYFVLGVASYFSARQAT